MAARPGRRKIRSWVWSAATADTPRVPGPTRGPWLNPTPVPGHSNRLRTCRHAQSPGAVREDLKFAHGRGLMDVRIPPEQLWTPPTSGWFPMDHCRIIARQCPGAVRSGDWTAGLVCACHCAPTSACEGERTGGALGRRGSFHAHRHRFTDVLDAISTRSGRIGFFSGAIVARQPPFASYVGRCCISSRIITSPPRAPVLLRNTHRNCPARVACRCRRRSRARGIIGFPLAAPKDITVRIGVRHGFPFHFGSHLPSECRPTNRSLAWNFETSPVIPGCRARSGTEERSSAGRSRERGTSWARADPGRAPILNLLGPWIVRTRGPSISPLDGRDLLSR